jgi:hypothetical protein
LIPKRVFWLTVGYGAGLGSSWYTARKVKAVARRYAPEGLTDRVGERVDDVKAAVVEGRAAMRRREMQLRPPATSAAVGPHPDRLRAAPPEPGPERPAPEAQERE